MSQKNQMQHGEFKALVRKIYINDILDDIKLRWSYESYKNLSLHNHNAEALKIIMKDEVETMCKKKEQIRETLCEMSGYKQDAVQMVNVITDTLFAVIKGYYNSIFTLDVEGNHLLSVDTYQVLTGMMDICIQTGTINRILNTMLLDEYDMPTKLLHTIVEVVPESDQNKIDYIIKYNESYDYFRRFLSGNI